MVLGVLTGCTATNQTIQYDVALAEVERPADTRTKYGEYTVSKQDTTSATGKAAKYVYSDKLLNAAWLYLGDSMLLVVTNNTDHSIKIDWDEAAFVMPGGRSDRVLLGNMSYAERNRSMPPTIVPKNATASTMLIPSSRVNWSSYGGLTFSPILSPAKAGMDMRGRQGAALLARKNIGKEFMVLVPVEIEGVKNEYTFNFEVKAVQVPDHKGEMLTYKE